MITHPRQAPAVSLACLSLALSVAVGCSKMAIDGEVVNATGQPLAGARVAAIGSQCMAVTDAAGKFELPCQPATYDLVISHEGYTSTELAVEAPERKRYNVGKQVLVKVPEQKGLFLFNANVYEPLKAGRLDRQLDTSDGSKGRAFCLNRDESEQNVVSAGVQGLFDYEHPGWRPFRLDAEGCAYRDVKKDGRWSVEYREKAEYETRQLNEGKTVVLMKLEPGEYFIADWKGFFVAVGGSEERHSYTGSWLTVQ